MAIYNIGPGQTYTTIGAVPWSSLLPGDTVNIHWQATPYHEKVIVNPSGSPGNPITINGVPGPSGQLPIVSGQNATTSTHMVSHAAVVETYSLFMIFNGFNNPVHDITIQGIQFQDAYQAYTFTNSAGSVVSYDTFSAAMYIQGGSNIVIQNCTLTNSGLGLYIQSNDSNNLISQNVLVQNNYIYGNGISGDFHEHNSYCECLGIIYQFNRYGQLRSGSPGAQLKDRSAGCIIRYNYLPAGAHILDLVDAEDSNTLEADPSYTNTYVYGNILDNTGSNASGSLVHFGGDSTVGLYRPNLYFYDNTIVSLVDQSDSYRLTMFEIDGQQVDVRNCIFYHASATSGQPESFFEFSITSGNLNFGTACWVSPGWLASESVEQGGTYSGTISGTGNFVSPSNNNPGFVNLAGGDYHLTLSSSARNLAGALFTGSPPVTLEYLDPQSGTARSAVFDLGAFESTLVPATVAATITSGPAAALVSVNPPPPATGVGASTAGPATALVSVILPSAATGVGASTAGPATTAASLISYYQIWSNSTIPGTITVNDGLAINLGVRFQSDVNGYVIGIRFYKGSTNTGTHVGYLWTNSGTLLASVAFIGETASGWQEMNFPTPVSISAATTYVASYFSPAGIYSSDSSYFATSGFNAPPLHALLDGLNGSNGVYTYGAAALFPTSTFNHSNYWVDIVFVTNPYSAGTLAITTASASGSAALTTTVSPAVISVAATFGSAISLFVANIPPNLFTASATSGPAVTTAALNRPTISVTTAAIAGPAGPVGTVGPGNDVAVFQSTPPHTPQTYNVGPGQAFTTVGAVPWSSLGPGDVVNIYWQPNPYYEKFSLSVSGTAANHIQINGIPGPSGQLPILDATNAVTSPNSPPYSNFPAIQDFGLIIIWPDSASRTSGYLPSFIDINNLQIQNAVPPNKYTGFSGDARAYGAGAAGVWGQRCADVTISGCTFTGNGNGVFFNSQGSLENTSYRVTLQGNSLHGNGQSGSFLYHNSYLECLGVLYQYNTYGNLAAGAAGNALKDRSAGTIIRYNNILNGGHNIDLVESQQGYAVIGRDPSYHQTYVYGNIIVSDPLGPTYLVHYGGDQGVPQFYRNGTLAFYFNTIVSRCDQSTRFRTIVFEMEDQNQFLDARNNILFNTSSTQGGTASVFDLANTGGTLNFNTDNWVSPLWVSSYAVETGGTFSGTINGTNLFVSPSNNNPGFVDFAGSDYRLTSSSSAVDLAGSLAVGWPPADHEYVAIGSEQPRPINGAAPDLGAYEAPPLAPQVVGETPALAATFIPVGTTVTATFNESVVSSSITFTLTGPAGAVPASVSYDDPSRTATLTPTSSLAQATAYTATVSGATDANGGVMTGPFSWSFTTAPPLGASLSIWGGAATPAVTSSPDLLPYELGVKFRSDSSGYVTGFMFYKGSANTGLHIGRLWSDGGGLLATAVFTNETSTGWQTVNLANPFVIASNVVYIVSYSVSNGGYAVDGGYFASSGHDNAPLHALAAGVDGPNGVLSTTPGSFPSSSFNSSNYWADVVLTLPSAGTNLLVATLATGPAAAAAIVASIGKQGTINAVIYTADATSAAVFATTPAAAASSVAGAASATSTVSVGAAPVVTCAAAAATESATAIVVSFAGIGVASLTPAFGQTTAVCVVVAQPAIVAAVTSGPAVLSNLTIAAFPPASDAVVAAAMGLATGAASLGVGIAVGLAASAGPASAVISAVATPAAFSATAGPATAVAALTAMPAAAAAAAAGPAALTQLTIAAFPPASDTVVAVAMTMTRGQASVAAGTTGTFAVAIGPATSVVMAGTPISVSVAVATGLAAAAVSASTISGTTAVCTASCAGAAATAHTGYSVTANAALSFAGIFPFAEVNAPPPIPGGRSISIGPCWFG